MQRRDVARQARKSNVIQLQLDATFFFERAVQSLDRCHYDKALKYFRKALEYEPDNPVNYCNTAGLLSELGRFDESNAMLRKILEDVDPSMTECYFYMANNYANMEDFIQAEQALIAYLERDPEGQYLDEAEEMVEWLSYELKRPVSLNAVKSRDDLSAHEQARLLMEAGNFAEAMKQLEAITQDHPDFVPAKNNLALAYYYQGEIQKGFNVIDEVLEQEPGNLHALCNLAVLLQHAGEYRKAVQLIDRLSKTVPFDDDHLFKFAMTLGILGRHEQAYPHFVRILKGRSEEADPSLFHYAAVAAANTKRYAQAGKLWRQAERLDSDSEVPKFYLRQLELAQAGEEVSFSYHYQLPFEEQFRHLVAKLPVWEHKWQMVIEQALVHMNDRFDMIELYDMQTLWAEFLSRAFPHIPDIRKIGGWAGALEYLTAKMHRRSVTYREISERYGVSVTTLRHHAQKIDHMCGLSDKMNAIFPHIQKTITRMNKS